jgi:hypothetical protein
LNEDEILIEAENAMQALLDNCEIFIDSIKEIESSNLSDRTKKVAIDFISKEVEESEKTVESIMEDVKKIQRNQAK